jgi:hypothetical protein
MVIGGGGGVSVGAPPAYNSTIHEFDVFAEPANGGNLLGLTGDVEYTNSVTVLAANSSNTVSEDLELRGATVRAYGTLNGGGCSYNGSGSSWSCTSDARLKADIRPLSAFASLRRLAAIEPVSFERIDGDGVAHDGFTAQNVAKAFPELVSNSGHKDALTPDGELALEYTGLIAPTVSAVQLLSHLVLLSLTLGVINLAIFIFLVYQIRRKVKT